MVKIEIRQQLPGWNLVWFRLVARPHGDLSATWSRLQDDIRNRYPEGVRASEPQIKAIRTLFRRAGCDPTRYRPSSEALLRRVLKGSDLPRIHPFVDLNNLISMDLALPCCIIDEDRVQPPFVFRSGHDGEQMLSMRGPFNLAGKPLLEDQLGPFGTPITDSERVKVTAETERVLLVVYGASGTHDPGLIDQSVQAWVSRYPVASLIDT